MPEGVGGFVAPQPVKPRTNKTEIQSTLAEKSFLSVIFVSFIASLLYFDFGLLEG